ncbi:hypothetical protein P3T73_08385 [Kiritimatiellota bacterium B12222]|nr:hypothetical protein P3T73_08385 [Kiritimatiellota bacterium B12222]
MPLYFKTRCRHLLQSLGAVAITCLQALLVSVMAFPPFFSATRVYAQTPERVSAPPASTQANMENLKDFFSAIKDMQESLSRDDFDPVTVVTRVGNEPEALRKWVADHITLVSYEGHLRSPSAVMMDGSANQIDRVVLLAQLLELAGHSPQISMAEVPADWAKQHMPMTFTADSTVRTALLPQTMDIPAGVSDPTQISLLNEYVSSRTETLIEVARRSENQLPLFSKALSPASAKTVEKNPSPHTHWWVSVETDQGLISLDPSSAPALEAQQSFSLAELPASYQQSVQVVVQIEQLKKGKRTEKVALSHTFLAGQDGNNDFQVGFTPKDVSMDISEFTENPDQATQALIEQFKNESSWMPYIRYAGETFSESGFTANGELVNSLASSAQGDKINEAAGLLGGLGQPQEQKDQFDASKGKLSRVTIAFILNKPGSEPEQVKRVIYQLNEDAAQAAAQNDAPISAGVALASVTDVLIQTSLLRRNYVSDKSLSRTLDNRNATLGSFHYESKNDSKKMQESMEKLTVFPQQVYDFALTRFMLNPHQNLLQITQPQLIAFQQTIRTSDQGEGLVVRGFDLIQTEIDILPGIQDAAVYRLEQGVVDASLEAVLANSSETHAFSASQLLEQLPQDQWVWIHNPAELAQLGPLSSEVETLLNSSLAKGEILFVPKSLGTLPSSQSAWWEMNPENGKMIGRIAEGGWGGSSSEYLVNLFAAKAQLLLLAVSVMMCSDAPGFACIFCSIVSATLIIGSIFAPGIGAAIAIAVGGMIANLGCTIGPML